MTTESDVEKRIIKHCSKIGATVFKNNTGSAFRGIKKRISIGGKLLTAILNPAIVKFGLIKGSSDLIGYTPVEITPEMVGTKLAVFTAIEVKKDKAGKYGATPEQLRFISNVKRVGGLATVADCEKDIDLLFNNCNINNVITKHTKT